MAATIFGFGTGEIKPQPGLSISRSESGGWTATHEVVIKSADLADALPNFASGTLLSSIDPDVPAPFDEFLKIDTVTIARTDGDLVTLSINATGGTAQYENDELQPDALPTYTLTGQLQDVHFSMHPKWKDISASDKTLLGKLIDGELWYDIPNDVLFRTGVDAANFNQLAGADAKEFASRIQQGQTTYQKSSYTWNEATEGEDQLTPAQINKLGHISTPRGDPPEPAGTRNWMLTNVSQSQSGELYRTTLEWTLSEEGGFDDFLYED